MVQKLINPKFYIQRALEISARRYDVLGKRFGEDRPVCLCEKCKGETFANAAENMRAVSDALFNSRLKLSSDVLVIGSPDTPAQRVEPLPRKPKLNPEDFEL